MDVVVMAAKVVLVEQAVLQGTGSHPCPTSQRRCRRRPTTLLQSRRCRSRRAAWLPQSIRVATFVIVGVASLLRRSGHRYRRQHRFISVDGNRHLSVRVATVADDEALQDVVVERTH